MVELAPPPVDERPAHGLSHAEFIAMMSLVTATIAASIDTILPAFDEIERQYDLSTTSSPISLSITLFFAGMGIGMLCWRTSLGSEWHVAHICATFKAYERECGSATARMSWVP